MDLSRLRLTEYKPLVLVTPVSCEHTHKWRHQNYTASDRTQQEHNRMIRIARSDITRHKIRYGVLLSESYNPANTEQQAASNCFYSPATAAADAPTDSPANLRLASEDGPGSSGSQGVGAGEGQHCHPSMPNPNFIFREQKRSRRVHF